MLPGLTRLRGLIVRFLFLLCSVFFLQIYPHFISTNEHSRLLLTSAIVDDGTFQIDNALQRYGDSQDKALYNGHYYSDKAIGISLLGVPVYMVLRLINVQPDASLYLFWLRLFCVTIPSICFVVFLSRFWERTFNGRWNISLAFVYMFGTVVFPYSLQFISHHLAGAALFLSFYFAWRASQETRVGRAIFLSGIFAGAAMIMEYPAFLQAGILFLYSFLRLRSSRKRSLFFAAGLLPFVILMLGYNYAIFGTPFDVTYRHMSDQIHVAQHSEGFVGMGLPNGKALLALLFSTGRGLFFFSSVLLLSIPGLLLLTRNQQFRLEGILILAITCSNLLFHAGMSNWDGGWSLGPRYLTPIVPFLMTTIAYFLSGETSSKSAKLFFYISSSIISIFMITVGTITFPFPAQEIPNPVFSLFWPMMLRGAYSLNLPELLGIHGPAVVVLFYTTLLIAFIVVTSRSGEMHFPGWKEVALPLAAVGCSLSVIIGGASFTPPPDAFHLYARASMYFFVGHCNDSNRELQEALLTNPEEHIKRLILQRLWQVSRVCGRVS